MIRLRVALPFAVCSPRTLTLQEWTCWSGLQPVGRGTDEEDRALSGTSFRG